MPQAPAQERQRIPEKVAIVKNKRGQAGKTDLDSHYVANDDGGDIEFLSAVPGTTWFRAWLEEIPQDADSLLAGSRLLELASRANATAASASADRKLRLMQSHYETHADDADLRAPNRGGSVFIRSALISEHRQTRVWRASCYSADSESDCDSKSILCELSQRFVIDNGQSVPDVVVLRQEKSAAGSERISSTTERHSPDARKDQLFKVACDVFAEKGFGGTTVRDIAESGKLPTTLMYQYVASKEELLFEIMRENLSLLIEHLQSFDYGEMEPPEKMRQAISRFIEFISPRKKVISLIYREARSLSISRRRDIWRLETEIMQFWEKIILSGQERGEFTRQDAWLAANAIYFLSTMWAQRYWAVGRYSQKDIYESVSRFALSGLTARR